MIEPLQDWEDADKYKHNLHVWGAQLDNKYLVEVQRKDNNNAKLYIFDYTNNNKLIFDKDVTLAYGAMWGPDSDDVNLWQEECIKFIDNLEETRSATKI